jgi:hypothetical protein
LYERFGRVLETDHHGEFVAISDGGEIILGPDEVEVATAAVSRFGARQFALRRVGFDPTIRMRPLTR